jgi:NAD(P)-dependent dehydrogenase (short-subunit alcohol dehydrogenase family)
MRFSGKTVVVLGGNSGIGLAAALAFQAEGARVAITGRNETTLAAVAAAHGLLAIRANVADVAATRTALQRIQQQLGNIDVLFANAGVGGFASLEQMSEGFWDEVHAVNLRGIVFAVQSAAPLMNDGGSIVITGSIGSMLPLAGNLVYAAAKAGLRAAARILGVELLPRKIRVNLMSPGPTNTEIFKRDTTPEQQAALLEMMRNNVPMKRVAEPEEMARAVLFLASSEASYINGVDLFVDGGCVEL